MPTPPPITAYPISIALVENDALLRQLLCEYLGRQAEFMCSIVVGSFEELWEELGWALPPRVVLLDLDLPGAGGLHGVPALRKRLPEADIILQTMHDDPAYLGQGLRAGATGYMVKNTTSLPQYKQLIFDVLNTGAAPAAPWSPAPPPYAAPGTGTTSCYLSSREQSVLNHLLNGLSNKEVAAALALSPETVHTYVKRLYSKLQVNSRSQLLSRAAKGVL